MTIAINPNLTDISLCEVITGWSLGTINAVDNIQGTNCIGLQVKAALSAIIKYDMGVGGTNFTGKHLFAWLKCNGVVDTKALGGFRLYVEDTSGNYGVWYVGGKDTSPMGWSPYVIDPASTPTTGVGTVNVALIRYVGCQFKTLTSALGSTLNVFWDAFRYGTGLTITSGTADAITFENIFAQDDNSTYKWGVVTKTFGCYLLQGLLTFGGTGSENIDFIDKNQIVLFPDNSFVSSTFYGIKVLAGSGTINFTLGEKSGTAGIKGCILKAIGTKTFSFDVSDTDIDKLQLYGCLFKGAGTITLLPNATNREVLNCNFDTCGELLANTCIMTNCNFISAVNKAIKIESASHNITHCNFIGNPTAIEITVATTISFSYLIFSGNTYVVLNSSGSAITVQYTNSEADNWNYDPAGSQVTFQTSITLTVRHVKTGSEPAEYVRCYIEKESDHSEIMNQDATVADDQNAGYYKATKSYTVTGIVVVVRAREKGYLPFEMKVTITSNGLDVTAVWIPDPNYQP